MMRDLFFWIFFLDFFLSRRAGMINFWLEVVHGGLGFEIQRGRTVFCVTPNAKQFMAFGWID